MKLIADYHIHSNNSKFKIAKASIEEIARRANSLGLKEIAITDHGYKHFFACNKQKLFSSKRIIEELNIALGTNVLLGIEADVLSENGKLDVDDDTLSNIDILIIGYHKMIKTDFASYFGHQKKTHEAISSATDAFINAIKRYDVDIVAHPGSGIKLDLYRLGRACAEYDVLIELNNRHLDFSEEEVHDLIRSGCHFVVSSDAYDIESVGKVDKVFDFIKKHNIPTDRISNVAFDNELKSELDQEIEADIERYNKLNNNKNNSYESQLSDEMEKKLKEIAKEKGYNISEEKIDYKEYLTESEREIVERAEAYLRRYKR